MQSTCKDKHKETGQFLDFFFTCAQTKMIAIFSDASKVFSFPLNVVSLIRIVIAKYCSRRSLLGFAIDSYDIVTNVAYYSFISICCCCRNFVNSRR